MLAVPLLFKVRCGRNFFVLMGGVSRRERDAMLVLPTVVEGLSIVPLAQFIVLVTVKIPLPVSVPPVFPAPRFVFTDVALELKLTVPPLMLVLPVPVTL